LFVESIISPVIGLLSDHPLMSSFTLGMYMPRDKVNLQYISECKSHLISKSCKVELGLKVHLFLFFLYHF